jgi:hypothetical protein
MTAKKMTDIFFGKFSELISTKSELEKTVIPSGVVISREKKQIIYYCIRSNSFRNCNILFELNRA